MKIATILYQTNLLCINCVHKISTTTYQSKTSKVGNIRLSNSAESVHLPVKRPSTRRIVLGANIPRQYPSRSSFRRHKEKQKGTNNNSNSSCSTARPKSTGGGFDSKSNTEGFSSTSNECCFTESSIAFKSSVV